MMEFKTVQSKEDFLEHLRSITKPGSPNFSAPPFSMLGILGPTNMLPFLGIIRPDGFHIAIVKGVYASSIALDGQVTETDSGALIRIKFDQMILTLVLHFLAVTVAFAMGTIVFWQTSDFRLAIIPYCFSGLAFTIAWYLRKIEKEKLLKRFLANTTAVKR